MSNLDKNEQEEEEELFGKPNKIVYVYDGDNDEDDKYFEECYEIERKIFEKFDKYLYVKIYVDSDDVVEKDYILNLYNISIFL